jgi:hypothetical protein
VTYFLQVQVVDSLDHLQKYLARDLLIETSAFVDAVEEFTALT